MLWPEMDGTLARRRLNTALWRLRQALDAPGAETDQPENDAGVGAIVVTSCGSLQLNAQSVSIDGQALLKFQTESPAQLATSSKAEFEEAVSIDPDELFAGCYHDVVVVARERLRNTHMRILSQLCLRCDRSGDLLSAIHWARRILEQDPYREDVHRILIRALRRSGRPREAQQQFDNCCALLRSELGVDPQPETRAALFQTLEARPTPPTIDSASQILTEAVTILNAAAAKLQKTLDNAPQNS